MEKQTTNKSNHTITFAIVLLLLIIILIYISTVVTWYKVFLLGQYYANASVFMTALFGLWPLIGGIATFLLSRYIIGTYKAMK